MIHQVYIILIIIYIIALVIGIEIFAYFWHRFGAHMDIIPGLHETHHIHHKLIINEADEDFIWLLLLLIIMEVAIGIGILIGLIPGLIGIITIITSFIVFYWNWYIHKAYHDDQHWLSSYSWFQLEKTRHFVHHNHPNLNFGIASHFSDIIFGTYQSDLHNLLCNIN